MIGRKETYIMEKANETMIGAIEMYRNALEEKINSDTLTLDEIEEMANKDDACRLDAADAIAKKVFADMAGEAYHDIAVDLLSGWLLLFARSGSWYSWKYFYERSRSYEGVNEIISNLGLYEDNAVDIGICKRFAPAARDIVVKQIFDGIREGVQYLLEIEGINEDDPPMHNDTIVSVYERTMANCAFYEKEGLNDSLLNEIGVLRGVAYCMEIVGVCPHNDDFLRFMGIQQELKRDDNEKFRARVAERQRAHARK